ncbi:uncharacterized protein LOC121732706 [Aricia agestis]|uniref:uncharacterized protein LOC121732706 n=1 Tax=Aricia agestis TaxID=91739 RepID=UPI001C2067DF|nr:uncharacterized protein LOC121732706 [Aricia agestis]
MLIQIVIIFVLGRPSLGFPKSLVWNGGPLHSECEHSPDLWTSRGQYVKENIIATKALTHNDKIFVITPRMKHGVLATVWQILQVDGVVELQPFPNVRAHSIADCSAVQNAVDFHIDHLGQLWVLDSGIVDTNDEPQCTCPPKVVVISIFMRKVINRIDLSSLTKPSTQLQTITVEYGIGGKPFVYVSDASRGAILVYDPIEDSGWIVLACSPSAGLQLALVKRTLRHSVLILVRLEFEGIIELDTTVLRRKMSPSTVTVLGGDTKAVTLLGSDAHHIYYRHLECSDVLRWDTREPYETSHHKGIHSPGPHLVPTSVASDNLKPYLLILESDYGDTILGNCPTHHRINFISV